MEIRKIAVTSADRDHVTGHAGKCRRFYLVDVEDDAVRNFAFVELEEHQTLHALLHEGGAEGPHPLDGIEVLISGGMGQGLARRLEGRSIQPVITPETDVEQAVRSFLSGSLPVAAPREKSHGQGHGCGCSCGDHHR